MNRLAAAAVLYGAIALIWYWRRREDKKAAEGGRVLPEVEIKSKG